MQMRQSGGRLQNCGFLSRFSEVLEEDLELLQDNCYNGLINYHIMIEISSSQSNSLRRGRT